MKKDIKKPLGLILIFALIVVCCTVLFACDESSPDTATYTCVENGIDYSITVDYDYYTFVMNVRDNVVFSYSGSFTVVDGYLKLTSVHSGEEYISVLGEKFSFVTHVSQTPNDGTSVCEHEYQQIKTFAGDCSTYSYVEYGCKKCSNSYKDYGAYGNHVYQNTQVVPSTCLAYGYTVRVCSICKKESRINETELGAHVPSGNVVSFDNGCCQKNTTKESCSVCHEVFTTTLEEYGSHNFVNGKCATCQYLDNGFSANHPDNNSDGKCDNCGLDKNLLTGMESNGYYILGNVVYFGYYPSSLSIVSAETIKKEGIYDKDSGYYRYNGESYAILTNDKVSSGTFSSGTAIKKNTEYAFIVEPIKWYIKNIDSNLYSLYCASVIDYSAFLQSINQKIVDGVYYNTFTNVSGVKANDFVYSELYSFINNSMKNHLLTKYQKSLITGDFSIISSEDISTLNIAPPTVSDYALIKGVSAISEYNITGKYNNIGNIFTKTASQDSNMVTAYITDKTLKSKSITLNYGFLPTITVNLG